MPILLGIDPGSRITGYGVIETTDQGFLVHAHGVIKVESQLMSEKLSEIFTGLCRVIQEYDPQSVGIEQVFVSKNPDSALKLGQARGAAICAAVFYKKPVSEYSARQVKQAVVGKGAATKSQVQQMVTRLLSLQKTPSVDAADALGVALCHAQIQSTVRKLGVSGARSTSRYRRGRLRVSDLPGF